MQKEALFGKTLMELQQLSKGLGLPSYTGKQLAEWLYKKDISSFKEMTDLSLRAREKLDQSFDLGTWPPTNVQVSSDGTKKYLFPTRNGQYIETAFIPEKDRATLCISSQAGCKMGCLFCMTGKQGFQGNLTSGEILNQVKSLPETDTLTNIVYMGMGEPLDNLANVLKSAEILTADYGWNWSPKRITVSTIGLLPALQMFLEQSNCHLAISLHSPFHEERLRLMPVESIYPVGKILNMLRSFNFSRQRRISFEYIMFKNINDTPTHVKELSKLLNGVRCRINLIRFHPIPGTPLEGSDNATIMSFKDALNKKGILTTIRASRGQDIFAACGLLSTKSYLKKEFNDY